MLEELLFTLLDIDSEAYAGNFSVKYPKKLREESLK